MRGTTLRFMDRNDAGRLLGAALREYGNRCDVAVAPVHERAEEVAENVARVLRAVFATSAESLPDVVGGTVILVDDGFDSSVRVYEATLVARDRGATTVVAVAPVGLQEIYRQVTLLVDRCLCLSTPTPFHSTGFWYADTMQLAAQLLFSRPGFGIQPEVRPKARRAGAAR